MNGHFTKEDNTDDKSAHEKLLGIISRQEIQIKTTLTSHYTPIRMAKPDSRKAGKDGEKRDF